MKKRFRILLTISEFMFSSQVRNLCDLISGLDKSIFDIEVGALAIGDEARGVVEALGVPHYVLRVLPARELNWRKLCEFLQCPVGIRKKNFDLVHSLLYQSISTEPLIIKLFSGAKYIYTKSNNQWDNHRLNWYIKSRLSDKIISHSRFTDEILARHGFKDKTVRISLGIDTGYFRESLEKRHDLRSKEGISSETLVYGCAAQFIECKEQVTVLKAFEQLCDKYKDISLLFCGPNHNDDYYRTFLKRLEDSSVKNRVYLLGTMQDMSAFYSAIDCFVLPSRDETFGYVYVEAMSCNRPVIACRAGGPLEIIEDGKNGFFTEISSPGDLAGKMERYIKDRMLIRNQGMAGRKRVESLFSKEMMARNHQELYLNVLKGI